MGVQAALRGEDDVAHAAGCLPCTHLPLPPIRTPRVQGGTARGLDTDFPDALAATDHVTPFRPMKPS